MTKTDSLIQKIKIIYTKIFHWEYWSSVLLYLPVLPYQLYLFAKARAVFFFNAANPGIENGGLVMESKWKMYTDAPGNYFPKTMFVACSSNYATLLPAVQAGFHFPLVVKPDIGSKGIGVAILQHEEELKKYHNSCPVNYLIQQKITYPKEAGIFYTRIPGHDTGMITGIVEKIFVQVTGDGHHTVLELLEQQPRYLLQLHHLQKIIDSGTLQKVLSKNERKLLLDIGNHARGACFLNAYNRITPALTAVIDKYGRQFPGFYYGRMDIRFNSWEELEQGQHFSIIELNGSGSEPTHIYDPANSLWYVWREICRHWKLLYQVAHYQHKVHHQPYQSVKEGISLLKANKKYFQKLRGFVFSPEQ